MQREVFPSGNESTANYYIERGVLKLGLESYGLNRLYTHKPA
jgi:hypothetical protein